MSFVRALKQNPSRSNNNNKIPPAVRSKLPTIAAGGVGSLCLGEGAEGDRQRTASLPPPLARNAVGVRLRGSFFIGNGVSLRRSSAFLSLSSPDRGAQVAGLQQAVLTLHAASSPPMLTPLCQLSARLQQLGLSAGFRWTGAVAAATLESAYLALRDYCYGCLMELKHLAESCYWLDTRLCFAGTEKRQLSEQPSKNNWPQC